MTVIMQPMLAGMGMVMGCVRFVQSVVDVVAAMQVLV